jgi:hypothetical protein
MFKRRTPVQANHHAPLHCCVLGLTLLLTSIGVAADPSLVGWWTFDEGSGTVAHDASGRGHDGTLRGGPTWVIGRVDGALLFDGKDDYVNIGSVGISAAVDRTVMAWVKASTPAIPDKTSVFGFVPDGSVEGTYFDVEVDDKGNYIAHICGYQWVSRPSIRNGATSPARTQPAPAVGFWTAGSSTAQMETSGRSTRCESACGPAAASTSPA